MSLNNINLNVLDKIHKKSESLKDLSVEYRLN